MADGGGRRAAAIRIGVAARKIVRAGPGSKPRGARLPPATGGTAYTLLG